MFFSVTFYRIGIRAGVGFKISKGYLKDAVELFRTWFEF